MIARKIKKGKITPNGIIPKPHEMDAAVFLTEQGLDVSFIKPVGIAGIHSPDFKINGQRWELKSPLGSGKYLMPNTIQRAVKQSNNIIIDLRKTKKSQKRCVRELKREFRISKSVKRLKIIMKGGKYLDLEK